MKLSQFDFELPEKNIARYPREDRDSSKMMVTERGKKKCDHKQFKDLVDYFDEGDVLVINNTKVFPARIFGQKEKTGADIEVFLLRELNSDMRLWDVMVDPARKIRVGNKIFFGEHDVLVAEVVDNTTSRGRTIRFIHEGDNDEFRERLFELGETPLPKSLERRPKKIDQERFQTLFAKETGSIAAPHANLHFSKALIKRMQIKGVKFAEVTLHVGMASFNEIDVEDLAKYKMSAEYFNVGPEAARTVNEAMQKGKRICAIGTSSMRALESAVTAKGKQKPDSGWTNLFIYPPFEFHIANMMVANFHLPKSPLMIMTCAFGGYDLVMESYEKAIENDYRFFTYGDTILIK